MPDLAATALARRPYDLRYAALSLTLSAMYVSACFHPLTCTDSNGRCPRNPPDPPRT